MSLARVKLATSKATNLLDREEESFPETDLESIDSKHSAHAVPMASEIFHLFALSKSLVLLLCADVAIATALRPLPEPILALRSRSLAAASATAFADALSFGMGGDLLGTSGGLWKFVNVCDLVVFRSDIDASRLTGVFFEGTTVSPAAPAAIIASAIAAGGEAKAADQPGVIIERAA